jgi:hypothetical protein
LIRPLAISVCPSRGNLSQCGRLGSRLLWNTPAPPARLVLYLMAHDELTAPPFEPFGSRMPSHFTAKSKGRPGHSIAISVPKGRPPRPKTAWRDPAGDNAKAAHVGHRTNLFPQRINDGRNRRLKKALDDVAHATATNAERRCARDIYRGCYGDDASGRLHQALIDTGKIHGAGAAVRALSSEDVRDAVRYLLGMLREAILMEC